MRSAVRADDLVSRVRGALTNAVERGGDVDCSSQRKQGHTAQKCGFSAWPVACIGLSIMILPLNHPLSAQPRVWKPEGPGPNTRGQVENILDREVVGAINAVAPHPTDAAIVYVGGANGGIWRTMNAMAASPSWEPQTDFEESLSIGALEFDPTDGANRTLAAGIGQFSSFFAGGSRTGVLRTTNGGDSWTAIDGGGTLDGLNISGIAPRGNTIVISVNSGLQPGILRTTDAGAAWTLISGAAGTGLPAGLSFDLASDPTNPARLFTNAGPNGIYRSTDTGATWTKVSDAPMDGLIAAANNLEIVVGRSNNVYAAIVTASQLAGVFRSGNGGNTWTAMDLPATAEGGIHLGRQGFIHLSLAADPNNANLVYIGGDVQFGPFPNSIGAQDFTGRLFRGDASQPAGSQWVHLTHSNTLGAAGGGTANGSAPHADSRDMDVAANGVLIEGNDGGIYRRTYPQTDTGDWFSMNGDIQTTEFHNVSWDATSNVVIGGAQDTGTPEQLLPSNVRWQSVATADGGDVAVDDTSTPGFSTRYSSFQNLGGFRRRVYDAANLFQSQVFPALTVLAGGNPLVRQFTTPIELNAVSPNRLIIGGGNSVYESLDQGNTITEIGVGIVVNAGGNDPISYGAAGNPDVLYVGSGTEVFVRTAANPAPLVSSASYPGTRGVRDIALDPQDPQAAHVVDSVNVFRTPDAGASWTTLTGNLPTLNPGVLRSITYSTATADGGIVVGANTGVFIARGCTGFTNWSRLGTGMPTVPVFDLEYDAADDILLAGTLGRGAWTTSLAGGPGTPQMQIPGNVDLGATCVGRKRKGTLNVCNTGSANLIVDPISSSDPRFFITTPSAGYPVVISPDFCFPFEAVFDGTGAGLQAGTFTIPSNDPVEPCATVEVSATGTEPDVRVTGSTEFGVASAWRPSEKSVSVCNTGACNLDVASALVDCADFTLVTNPFPAIVSPDSCLDLIVRFSPTLPGPKSCSLTLTTADPDTPTVVLPLTARTAPSLSFQAGLVLPHGTLSNTVDSGSTLTVGFVYPMGPHWAWDARVGFSTFAGSSGQAGTDLWTAGGNAKYTLNPAAPARLFLNGGFGLYHFDPGELDFGGNVGLGLDVPIDSEIAIEATYNFHSAFTASPIQRFSQFQLGLVLSF